MALMMQQVVEVISLKFESEIMIVIDVLNHLGGDA